MRGLGFPRSCAMFILLLAFAVSFQAVAQSNRFNSVPGSKVRVEGTSNVPLHTEWQMQGLIGGYVESGANFPTTTNAAVKPGKLDLKADVFVFVRSLKSIEKDGKPYSDKMDDIVYDRLKQPANPRISYHLDELTLKEVPAKAEGPFVLDSKGDLVIAGVTNKISMPVTVTLLPDNKLKISGSTPVKMTQFGIAPPAPALAFGLVKVGDEVKVIFEWIVAQKAAAK